MPAKTKSEIEWIPVTERLPEPYTDVLYTGKVKGCFVSINFLLEDGTWMNDDGEVIAWAELPEPYEVKYGSD